MSLSDDGPQQAGPVLGTGRRVVRSYRFTLPAYSPFHETVEGTPRPCPTLDHGIHPTRGPFAPQVLQKPFAGGSVPFGDDLDPAVLEIGRSPAQSQLERFGPRPPAKTDALDVSAYPRRHPDLFVGLGHGFTLPHLLVTFSSPLCPLPRVAPPSTRKTTASRGASSAGKVPGFSGEGQVDNVDS